MSTEIINIPLTKLVQGDKAKGGSINSRKTEEPIDGLARSISAHGLLVPLLVRNGGDPGMYYVMDGNRRLAALNQLNKNKDTAVPCIRHEKGNALELSMVVNVDRAELHPVDRFEVFAALVEAGETVDALAKRYAMKVEHVRQALALGKLAPSIRDAWRNGDIAAEEVEAFALTSDHKAQTAALKKLGKHCNAYMIRQHLMGGRDYDVGLMLQFVGKDVYEKAGFHVNASLFGDEDNRRYVTVSDLPALKRLADEQLHAECERLKSDGWKWAITKGDAPNDIYAWKRLRPDSGRFTKEQMAEVGCVVSVSHAGKLDVERGYVKPGDKVAMPKSPKEKKQAAKQREEKKEATGGIGDALAFRMSLQLGAAVREAFLTGVDNRSLLAFVIASLACYETPFKISAFGDLQMTEDMHSNDFVKYFKLAHGKKTDEQLKLLASWVSRTIDLSTHDAVSFVNLLHPDKDADKNARTLVSQISEKSFDAAVRKHFDHADYFNGVSKELICEAVQDALGKEHLARVSKMKASEAKAYAIKHVPKTGWVPEGFRF